MADYTIVKHGDSVIGTYTFTDGFKPLSPKQKFWMEQKRKRQLEEKDSDPQTEKP